MTNLDKATQEGAPSFPLTSPSVTREDDGFGGFTWGKSFAVIGAMLVGVVGFTMLQEATRPEVVCSNSSQAAGPRWECSEVVPDGEKADPGEYERVMQTYQDMYRYSVPIGSPLLGLSGDAQNAVCDAATDSEVTFGSLDVAVTKNVEKPLRTDVYNSALDDCAEG